VGIDYLDIVFRIEKLFHARLDLREFEPVVRDRKPWDMTVAELIREVESKLEKRTGHSPDLSEIDEPVRRIIADALGAKPEAVRSEAWLIKDLGMT